MRCGDKCFLVTRCCCSSLLMNMGNPFFSYFLKSLHCAFSSEVFNISRLHSPLLFLLIQYHDLYTSLYFLPFCLGIFPLKSLSLFLTSSHDFVPVSLSFSFLNLFYLSPLPSLPFSHRLYFSSILLSHLFSSLLLFFQFKVD